MRFTANVKIRCLRSLLSLGSFGCLIYHIKPNSSITLIKCLFHLVQHCRLNSQFRLLLWIAAISNNVVWISQTYSVDMFLWIENRTMLLRPNSHIWYKLKNKFWFWKCWISCLILIIFYPFAENSTIQEIKLQNCKL